MPIDYWNDEVEARFRKWESSPERVWNRKPQLTMPLPAIAPSVNSGQCPAMAEKTMVFGQATVTLAPPKHTGGKPPKSLALESISTGLGCRKTAKLIGGVSHMTIWRARKEMMNHEQ